MQHYSITVCFCVCVHLCACVCIIMCMYVYEYYMLDHIFNPFYVNTLVCIIQWISRYKFFVTPSFEDIHAYMLFVRSIQSLHYKNDRTSGNLDYIVNNEELRGLKFGELGELSCFRQTLFSNCTNIHTYIYLQF